MSFRDYLTESFINEKWDPSFKDYFDSTRIKGLKDFLVKLYSINIEKSEITKVSPKGETSGTKLLHSGYTHLVFAIDFAGDKVTEFAEKKGKGAFGAGKTPKDTTRAAIYSDWYKKFTFPESSHFSAIGIKETASVKQVYDLADCVWAIKRDHISDDLRASRHENKIEADKLHRSTRFNNGGYFSKASNLSYEDEQRYKKLKDENAVKKFAEAVKKQTDKINKFAEKLSKWEYPFKEKDWREFESACIRLYHAMGEGYFGKPFIEGERNDEDHAHYALLSMYYELTRT